MARSLLIWLLAVLATTLARLPQAAAESALGLLPSFEAEPSPWRVFVQYDYFVPANSKTGLQDQLHALSQDLVASGSADTTALGISANGGSGSRIGAMRRLDGRTQIGGSLGYILGPTMNANFSATSSANGNGGLTVNRSATYVRALAQTSVRMLDRGPWSGSLESALGVGFGHVNQSCNSSGSLSCAGNVDTTSKDWIGFTWGFGLNISRSFELATLGFGPRYEGFPRFKGTDRLAAIDWQAFGLFLTAQF